MSVCVRARARVRMKQIIHNENFFKHIDQYNVAGSTYVRYEGGRNGQGTGLESPSVCNTDITVSFSAFVTYQTNPKTSLRVFAKCNSQFLQHTRVTVDGQRSLHWRHYNTTLPACRSGQRLSVSRTLGT